ncbi:MAG TPA: beta-ketoacyl synthase N-terminal-like domain-containing protein [Bacteroidia bacterium]|jgi:3-oxoacyl-[acyl-carrier-protein] synthase-1|nr:beta-ketoacyl synthase N-terminal-like domain-containing protein [Bacteroidia bacterium]
MKLHTYIAADNIISPLGFTSEENFEQLKQMKTGVQKINSSAYAPDPIHAALIDDQKIENEFEKLNTSTSYTRLEKLILLSVTAALKQNTGIDVSSKKTLLIISTTKGNIDLLDPTNAQNFDKKRVYLWETARIIQDYFKLPNKPLIVSNACISGVLGIIIGKRLLESGTYENVIVCGVDILTEFVVSGFLSFKAVSATVAKPYDESRDGISLGEGCGTLVLTSEKARAQSNATPIIVTGGATSNDANHISGPSRTGDGLLLAIEKTLQEANVSPQGVHYISGHGTATLFNDEMEALAITDAKLASVPMNSLKSYFGHTLGAAGVIESIIGIHSMRHNTLIGTYQFNKLGVSKPINILKTTQPANVDTCLKTAAGFGGCNAAVLFQKQILQ